MFNVCKRSAASLSRFGVRVTPQLSQLKPLVAFSPRQCIPKSIGEARCLQISAILRDQQNDASSAPVRREVKTFQELADFNMVHPNVVNEITNKMKHVNLTEVQVATINEGLQGVDIIAQARTGTGKTLGFLIPTIQNILRKNPELASRKKYSRARASDIRAIIISPTRELAEQIAVEAQKLCYNTDLIVQVAVGGNSKRQMLMKTQREGCHLLVATPGRLMDLLTDPRSGVSAPNITTLVLDEADRLLDDGFSKDIEEVTKILPNRSVVDRQTLLFSATVPREVMHLVRKTLKPDFHFVQTVKEGEPATHEKVPQNIIVTPGIENWMPSLVELGRKTFSRSMNQQATPGEEPIKPFKAIVYFTSTAQVQLAFETIKNLQFPNAKPGMRHPLYPAELFIINGQMTQEGRTRAANRFRNCSCGILFSTDVTARGMDFPGVSHVLQFGLPPNREQYIHRIGRTGRGDKTGDGFIFVDKASLPDAKRMLRGLPITERRDIQASQVDMSQEAELPEDVAENIKLITEASKLSYRRSKDAAYKSALNNVKTGEQTLSLARWTKYAWGYEQPPSIGSMLAGKLGLSRLPGINIGRPDTYDDEPASGSLGGRSNSFGGRSNSFGSGQSGGFGGRSSSFGGRSSGFGDRGGFGGRSGGFGDRGGDRGGFGGRSSGFGDRGGDRGGFGDRGGDRGGFGGRSSGFGDRGGDRGGFGGRSGGFGDRGGDRGGFGDRGGDRGGFGGRSGGFGDRGGDRGGFGDRGGDRGGFGGRSGGFGDRGGDRGGFGGRSGGFGDRGGDRGGFGGRSGGFGDRGGDRGGFGGRSRGGFGDRGGDRNSFGRGRSG